VHGHKSNAISKLVSLIVVISIDFFDLKI
jgi:hypothetical protein